MKVLIFSDSHGQKRRMVDIAAKEKPSLILHLGDHEADAAGTFANVRTRNVKGNCDYNSVEEETRRFDLGDVKIFMTHGHRYRVKFGLEALTEAALAAGANVILFGHTHRPYLQKYPDYTIMNPGTPDQSYGMIEIEDGKLKNITLKETNFI
ncbi:MAG TPA: YfcE family phosphodiesterase [Clostridiales bacterium]|nr:YfcE family phosphodiesterase [Clostridiales bacterium]